MWSFHCENSLWQTWNFDKNPFLFFYFQHFKGHFILKKKKNNVKRVVEYWVLNRKWHGPFRLFSSCPFANGSCNKTQILKELHLLQSTSLPSFFLVSYSSCAHRWYSKATSLRFWTSLSTNPNSPAASPKHLSFFVKESNILLHDFKVAEKFPKRW